MHLVFSSYRSGSTTYCDSLSARLMATNRGEWFHEMSGEDWITRYRRISRARSKNFVVNVMTPQVPKFFASGGEKLKEIDALLAIGPQVHFTVRKDFNAACKSYLVAERTDSWNKKETWASVRTIECTQDHWDNIVRYMRKVIVLLSKIYHYVNDKGFQTTLHYLEDRDNYSPYTNRNYEIYMLEGDLVSAELDVVKLFESREFAEEACKEYK